MKNLFKSQLLVILFGLGILSSCGGGDDPEPGVNSIPNEQVRLLFNGNATDELGNITATPTQVTLVADRKGNPNGAYKISNENSMVVVKANSKLSGLSSFSISMWFNPEADFGTFFHKRNEYRIRSRVQITNPCENPNIICESQRDLFCDLMYDNTESFKWNYDTDEWHHLVATYNDGTTNIYLDNVLKKTITGKKTGQYSDITDLIIGNRGGGEDPIQATVDEFRFYSRAITEAEVALLYSDKQ